MSVLLRGCNKCTLHVSHFMSRFHVHVLSFHIHLENGHREGDA